MLSASLIASKTDAALFVQSFMYEAPFWTGVKPIYARERREEEAAFVGVKSTVKKKKKKKKRSPKMKGSVFHSVCSIDVHEWLSAFPLIKHKPHTGEFKRSQVAFRSNLLTNPSAALSPDADF